MQRVKQKAEQSRENRENIELPEEKVSIRGEPIPFKVRSCCTYIAFIISLTAGLHSHGRSHSVQEGPEGRRGTSRVQGGQAEQ